MTKKVCIIGGGLAGIACAWSLAKSEQKVDVEVWEMDSELGGIARSVLIDEDVAMNYGVHYHPPSAAHIHCLNEITGHSSKVADLSMFVGFGNHDWSTLEYCDFLRRLNPEISRFYWLINCITFLQRIMSFIPIGVLLCILGFTREFRFNLLYPLLSLYYGDVRKMAFLPSSLVAKSFLGPNKLFEYDNHHLVHYEGALHMFPDFRSIIDNLVKQCELLGVKFFPKRQAFNVRRENGFIFIKENLCDDEEKFHEVVFACGAETCRKLLNKNATFWENLCLSGVKYMTNSFVIHSDQDYIDSDYFEQLHDSKLPYQFLFSAPNKSNEVEKTMVLNNLQESLSSQPMIYQSHFYNQNENSTKEDIDITCIYMLYEGRSIVPNCRHFCRVLPFIQFIQSARNHTWYCGGWTLKDTHEDALISGLAAAYRITGHYPQEFSKAKCQFNNYLNTVHGVNYSFFKCLWSKIHCNYHKIVSRYCCWPVVCLYNCLQWFLRLLVSLARSFWTTINKILPLKYLLTKIYCCCCFFIDCFFWIVKRIICLLLLLLQFLLCLFYFPFCLLIGCCLRRKSNARLALPHAHLA